MDTNMTNKEITDLLLEVLDRYQVNRQRWIEQTGNDEGFNEWFTDQVKSTNVRWE